MKNNKIIYTGFAQAGSYHLSTSKVCQDKFYCIISETLAYFSVADGAGSAEFSELGAESILVGTHHLLNLNFDEYYHSNVSQVKKNIIEHLLRGLNNTAKDKKISINDLAATLLFVAIKDDKIIAGHCGDGLIAYKKNGEYKLLSLPENGEFLNQTFFITSPNSTYSLRLYRGEAKGIEKFILMTDGVTHRYYDKKNNIVTQKFISDIEALNYGSNILLNDSLKQLMIEKINKETNDDSAMVVAYSRK